MPFIIVSGAYIYNWLLIVQVLFLLNLSFLSIFTNMLEEQTIANDEKYCSYRNNNFDDWRVVTASYEIYMCVCIARVYVFYVCVWVWVYRGGI